MHTLQAGLRKVNSLVLLDATVPLCSEGLAWRGLISALLMNKFNVCADAVMSTDRFRSLWLKSVKSATLGADAARPRRRQRSGHEPQGTSPGRRIPAGATLRWCLPGILLQKEREAGRPTMGGAVKRCLRLPPLPTHQGKNTFDPPPALCQHLESLCESHVMAQP